MTTLGHLLPGYFDAATSPSPGEWSSGARARRLRGDADGRSPDDYLPELRDAGAMRLEGGVLEGSGEFAPLEVPEAFIQKLRSFAQEATRS